MWCAARVTCLVYLILDWTKLNIDCSIIEKVSGLCVVQKHYYRRNRPLKRVNLPLFYDNALEQMSYFYIS